MLKKQRAIEAETLEHYGWVDQKGGIARLPIAEAKKKLLHDGLPSRTDGAVDAWLGTSAAAGGESSGGRRIPVRRDKSDLTILKPQTEATPPQQVPSPGSRRNRIDEARAAHFDCVDRPDGCFLPRGDTACGARAEPVAATAAGRANGSEARTSVEDRDRPAPQSSGAARSPLRRRDWQSGEAGGLLRQAAGPARTRLLRVPDALHPGAQRRDRSAQGAEFRCRA